MVSTLNNEPAPDDVNSYVIKNERTTTGYRHIFHWLASSLIWGLVRVSWRCRRCRVQSCWKWSIASTLILVIVSFYIVREFVDFNCSSDEPSIFVFSVFQGHYSMMDSFRALYFDSGDLMITDVTIFLPWTPSSRHIAPKSFTNRSMWLIEHASCLHIYS